MRAVVKIFLFRATKRIAIGQATIFVGLVASDGAYTHLGPPRRPFVAFAC